MMFNLFTVIGFFDHKDHSCISFHPGQPLHVGNKSAVLFRTLVSFTTVARYSVHGISITKRKHPQNKEPMADESVNAAADAVRAVLDLSVTAPGGFSISLRIDNVVLAGIATVGALSLGAFYVANRFRVENAIRNGLENRNEAGMVDPEVRNIEEGSIVVELHFHSEKSFLQFMEDFGARKVKNKLEEEFTKIGFQRTLKVTIINADEVRDKVNEIRYIILVKPFDIN